MDSSIGQKVHDHLVEPLTITGDHHGIINTSRAPIVIGTGDIGIR